MTRRMATILATVFCLLPPVLAQGPMQVKIVGPIEIGTAAWANAAGTATDATARATANLVSNQVAGLTQDVVRASREFVVYSLTAGALTSNGHVIATAYLTNGYSRTTFDYDPSSEGVALAETSTDSNTWGLASSTGSNVYWRLRTSMYTSAAAATNILVYGWRAPELVGRTNDMKGQKLLVDSPTLARQAAPKTYVDAAVSNNVPSAWAQYAASENVKLAGKKLMWDTYSLLSDGTFAALTYTVASSQNWFRIQHSGDDLLRISASNNMLAVTNFALATNNNYFSMNVWTGDLVSAPWPEYTTNLVEGYWTRVPAWTSVTNGDSSVTLTYTNDWTGGYAFFRALCAATNETVTDLLTDKTTAKKLEVDSVTLGGVNRTTWPDAGVSGTVATQIVENVNTSQGCVTNVSGGILSMAARTIGLTYAAITNALAGTYAAVVHGHDAVNTATNALQLGGVAASVWSNKVFAMVTNQYYGGWYSIGNSVTSLLARAEDAQTITQIVSWAEFPGVCTSYFFTTTYWSNSVTGASSQIGVPHSATGSLVNCYLALPAGGGLWQVSCVNARSSTNVTFGVRGVQ